MDTLNEIWTSSEVCEICLRSCLLKVRDLTDFYTVCTAETEDWEDMHSWLCSFCWTRVMQCIRFISTARRSKHRLDMKCNIAQPTDLYPYTSQDLPEITLKPNDAQIISNDAENFKTITVLLPPVQPEQLWSDEDVRLPENFLKTEASIKLESDNEFDIFNEDNQNDSDVELSKLCKNDANEEVSVGCKRTCAESDIHQTNGVKSKVIGEKFNYSQLSWLESLKLEEENAKALGLELVQMTEDKQLEEIVNKKQSMRYKMAKYKCEQCGHICLIERCLRQHIEAYHNENMTKPHQCNICYFRFQTPKALLQHKATEHERRWRCKICLAIVTRERWDQHGTNCSPDGKHECDVCHKKYKTKAYLYKHTVATHTPKPRVICDICNKSYKQKAMLESHMRVHTGERPYECDACDKKYISYSLLCNHKKLKHEPIREEPLEERYCVECDKHFKNKKSLERHLTLSWMHGDPDTFEFECEYCHKKITTQAKKDLHIKIHHLKIRDHQCPHCEKTFPSKYHLRSHVRALHGNSKGRRQRSRRVCDTCGFAFTDIRTLQEHRIAVHEKLRPHKCQVCNATFGFKAALFTHNKLKHGGSKAGKRVPLSSPSGAQET